MFVSYYEVLGRLEAVELEREEYREFYKQYRSRHVLK